MEWIAITAGVLALVIIVLLMVSLQRVREGHEYAVERFGRFRRTLGPGAAFIVPFAERVAARHAMGEQLFEVVAQRVVLADGLDVSVRAGCAYQITNVAKATYEVVDLPKALEQALAGAISHALGALSMERVLAERARLAEHVREAVEAASEPWGVRITRVDLVEINPPASVSEAVAAQRQANMERDTARTRAEAAAEGRLASAEAERRIAEMDAEAERLRVEKLAASRERMVEAEVRAALMLAQALDGDGQQALDYFIARQYVDVLASLARSDGNTVLAVPTDALASNLASVIARQQPRPAARSAPGSAGGAAGGAAGGDADEAAAFPFGGHGDATAGEAGGGGG